MKWTKDQQKVIDLRNRNILVSAAAGSGKTAVLVERIISMISEGENPIDIDRLLIVTFTNAAAAEMRERIGLAIEKKINDTPDDLHLQKQMMLIHTAQITTIHSFCLYVIRNYFNTINLEPSFRIGDESELTLLKSDVISDLLEEYYEEGREDFLDFIECFASGKSDSAIEELILKLHDFSMSFPWPDEWLEEKKKSFHIHTIAEMETTDWMEHLKDYIQNLIEDMEDRCDEVIHLCEGEDGPFAYLDALYHDKEQLESLGNLQTYEEYYEVFRQFKFARLSNKKQEGVSQEKKDRAKSIRNEIKSTIQDIGKYYFFQTPEEMVKDIQAMKNVMEVLIEITKSFSKAYGKKKESKNLVDFNDLEHFCLNILVKKEEDKLVYTLPAKELSDYYEEILIDEYQDSNFVQETILNSISRERFGEPNRFMVGDVKQSIYKFRLARPEIFMGKYEHYEITDSKNQRIDLHQNFRSRNIILDSVNLIFEQIMTKRLGNITYDDKAALYPGADYGDQKENVSEHTEVILIDPTKEDNDIIEQEEVLSKFEGQDEELDAKELEAKAIASRIKELTHPVSGLLVLDKETKEYRRAQYKDIVILLRTMSNWSDVFAEILASEGIPAHAQTQTGYFDTLEIRTIINLLKIIDNPRQDIPFTAILRSAIVGLDSNQLAKIRMVERKSSMYEAAVEFVQESLYDEGAEQDIEQEDISIEEMPVEEKRENSQEDTGVEKQDKKVDQEDVQLGQQLNEFLSLLQEFRTMVYYLPIHELILKVFDRTRYYNIVSAMPGGEKRRANMDMLVQKSIQFEATSYSGLFHFIRYIEKLHKYDIDYGEAETVRGSDNSVKIMSIHKSKGLEFPIVFASGLGKNFNQQDTRAKLIIHPDLGLGPDFIDPKLRVKAPTLLKKVIQKSLLLENLGEELRILYVAMTRAKEKLILTGTVKKLEDRMDSWKNICEQNTKELLYYQLSSASTFLDWIIPAILRLKGLEIYEQGEKKEFYSNEIIDRPAKISLRQMNYNELAYQEVAEQVEKMQNKYELENWDSEKIYDEQIRSKLLEQMEYQYPYASETKIHAKLTVSELKRLGQLEKEDLGLPLKGINNNQAEQEIRTPNFIQEEKEVKGATLGTLYHRILEKNEVLYIKTQNELEQYLQSLIDKNEISKDDLKAINQKKLFHFLSSEIAKRMRMADKENKLFTERQFIMGVKAKEINEQMKSEELVLVQGVIDVYFEENQELVLLDYKSDHVNKSDGEQILMNRYLVQFDYYQKALEQLTGKKVKERLIYSLELDKGIIL